MIVAVFRPSCDVCRSWIIHDFSNNCSALGTIHGKCTYLWQTWTELQL